MSSPILPNMDTRIKEVRSFPVGTPQKTVEDKIEKVHTYARDKMSELNTSKTFDADIEELHSYFSALTSKEGPLAIEKTSQVFSSLLSSRTTNSREVLDAVEILNLKLKPHAEDLLNKPSDEGFQKTLKILSLLKPLQDHLPTCLKNNRENKKNLAIFLNLETTLSKLAEAASEKITGDFGKELKALDEVFQTNQIASSLLNTIQTARRQ